MSIPDKADPKYLLNSLSDSVRDNLIGLSLTNDEVQVAENVDAIIRKDFDSLRKNGSVLVISGGGAGHEPMFAGFVGRKMLTAAVSGSYFASPSAGQIIRLTEEISSPDTPILYIIANYTGDRLNFGLAKEYLTMKGYKDVRLFTFGDDIAPYLADHHTGDLEIKRRGLAGLLFVHKLAGALSEQAKSLIEIESCLKQFSKLIFTISISLSACDIPGHGASFKLESNLMELGLGVHGESGIRRVSLLSAKDTVGLLADQLVSNLKQHSHLAEYNNRIALIVNNLGGLTQIELNVINKEVVTQITANGFTIERIFSGPVMTSFNMKGVSLSLMFVDDEILSLLDQSPQSDLSKTGHKINSDFMYKFKSINATNEDDSDNIQQMSKHCNLDVYRQILLNACNQIIKHEHELNKLDETVGDSDCGSTLSSIARLFLGQIESSANRPPSLAILARLVGEHIGGSSGALYSLLFTAAFNYIRQTSATTRDNSNRSNLTTANSLNETVQFWLALLEYSVERISTYSGAKFNDRSMIDGLHGIIIGLGKCLQTKVTSIADIGRIVAESTWIQARLTATMKARVGRAAYVNEAYVTEPDAGAIAVAIWVQAMVDTLTV